jgi:GTP-binding protein
MFVDRVKIFVKGGDGGRGCVSFRREAHVPRGGPDGGNGGPGGDVLLEAVSHQNTLLPLRYHTEFRAERGEHGGPANRTGARGNDLVIPVPPGTVAIDEGSGAVLGEVLREGERLPVARGGRGGRGNRSFLSNRNRAPREAEPGGPGEERWLRLDLRLIADVGLLGFPNAGKSTLLSRISAARPKVADYPFTTLSPVLGVVEIDERTFVAADIPGIIEGAHRGAGLGLQFLRHVERTRVLLHVIDASGLSGRDPVSDLLAVREEVRQWNEELLQRPQLVAATKRDTVEPDHDPLPALADSARSLALEVLPVSAVTGAGLSELKRALLRLIPQASAEEPERNAPTPGEPSGGADQAATVGATSALSDRVR